MIVLGVAIGFFTLATIVTVALAQFSGLQAPRATTRATTCPDCHCYFATTAGSHCSPSRTQVIYHGLPKTKYVDRVVEKIVEVEKPMAVPDFSLPQPERETTTV